MDEDTQRDKEDDDDEKVVRDEFKHGVVVVVQESMATSLVYQVR